MEPQKCKEDTASVTSSKDEEEEKKRCCRIPWGGILALLGGFLIQLTLGSFYSFGNMMTYMTSYMRAHGSPNLTYTDFVVVQSVWGMTQGTVMPISGFLVRFIGPRVAMFGGCAIFSLGTALTYFTIGSSLPWVGVSYGFVQALGQSIALIPTMTIGMRWFPKRKGMAMGIVVGGFGGGSFIFNLIQTAILNPDNVKISESGYFTDPELLDRVPKLMLILSGIYLSVQLVACLMVTEPPACKTTSNSDDQDLSSNADSENCQSKEGEGEVNISPRDALRRKELYILWLTRFSVVMITQTVAAFYKAFGQSFISDDHFLAIVGAICSLFNCSGRLFYGLLMDKTTYRLAMMVETVLLVLLCSTFFLTTFGGKAMFAAWVWLIFFTFPGTYSTQPAITTQTFGHEHGGTIYGFLFTSDIVNNLLVGLLSKPIKEAYGWLGLFLILAAFALFAALITCFFPWNPSPEIIRKELDEKSSKKDESQEKEVCEKGQKLLLSCNI